MWARFGVVAFSVCRHVGDVAHSTSHEPTRSGMEPDVKKFVDFLVWVITFGGGRIFYVYARLKRGQLDLARAHAERDGARRNGHR